MKHLIDQLYAKHSLPREKILQLLNSLDKESKNYLHEKANQLRHAAYGNRIYMRGLIEFTNYCVQNCLYCGIRCENKNADRYRLPKQEIIDCCEQGYRLGYRTFVLQGGEDPYFTDEKIIDLITIIKDKYPECAITLSIGEKSYESYKRYYDAGADRYLLRHETSTRALYEALHPKMSYENRIKCLYNLKKIGFQVGAGFLVGLPNQTNEDYVNDLVFLKKLQPHMIGIGPFIPQKNTPLSTQPSGTVEKTCVLLSMIRLLLPDVLLPATTALGSLSKSGREKGLKSGANVVMPNLSPSNVREKYALYDGKISTGDEGAQHRKSIEDKIRLAGYVVDMGRGDYRELRMNNEE